MANNPGSLPRLFSKYSYPLFRLVCATRPHIQRVERVVGIGFQPGLDVPKVSTCQMIAYIAAFKLIFKLHSSA